MSTSTCPYCGTTLFGLVSRCYKCGKEVDIAERTQQERERSRSETIENEAQNSRLDGSVFVLVVQGLFELLGLGGFLAGFFLDIAWLMVTGGILVVLDDVIEIAMGILNPLLPILLAVVLAVILTPWYVGIFWASSAFKVLNIPTSFRKVFTPGMVVASSISRSGDL